MFESAFYTNFSECPCKDPKDFDVCLVNASKVCDVDQCPYIFWLKTVLRDPADKED